MTNPNDVELECPKCGHKNPAKADYCWECRFDFVHDERLREAARTAPPPPPPSARPIPPPYSTRPPTPEQSKPPREHVSAYAFLIELIVSIVIVGGTFAIYSSLFRDAPVIYFVIAWVVALIVVRISEGVLPDPETDLGKYWSWNPFQYRDDMHRKVLAAHIWLFLPRIVLRTVRRGFSLVLLRHRST